MTRLLSLFPFLFVFIFGNISHGSLDLCGFEFASVEEWIWPVFLHDPGEAGEMQIPSVDVMINREGKPISLIRNNIFPDNEYAYLRNIIPAMLFKPGNSCEEPIESYARCAFEEFFVQKEPSPDTPNLVPPFTRWRITNELIHQLDYYGMTYKESLAIVDFFIDEEGNLKKTKGLNDYGKTLSRKFFKPDWKKFKFRPATVGGVPVQSKIRLFFGEDKVIGQETEYVDNASEPFHTLRHWPEAVPLEKLFEVNAELTLDSRGNVSDIRLLNQMPSPVARQIVQDLRSWRLDTAIFKEQESQQNVFIQFAYDPLDRSPALLKVAAIKSGEMTGPKPIKQPPPLYPSGQMRKGNAGIVMMKFVITKSGNVGEKVVEFASDKDFAEATIHAMKDWKFEPATRKGEKVACWVRQAIPFTISSR